jgi:predicted nuclease of predicted toxin-antitoxin system
LSNTKIRLLLDECVPAPIAREIENCSGISSIESITALHQLGNRHTSDYDVVAYAKQQGRVLVTVEGRLNEKQFTICTHEGIIVINATRRHEAEKVKLFTKFMRSGHRAKCYHAVTKLRLGISERLERAEDGSIRRVLIHL